MTWQTNDQGFKSKPAYIRIVYQAVKSVQTHHTSGGSVYALSYIYILSHPCLHMIDLLYFLVHVQCYVNVWPLVKRLQWHPNYSKHKTDFKRGLITDPHNYRPIAITGAASSTMIETVILQWLQVYIDTTDNQFRYRAKHCTEMCVFTLKSVIDQYLV